MLIFIFGCPLFADQDYSDDAQQTEKTSIEDKIIGSSFKSLARIFVLTIDAQRLKEANIRKLEKMDPEKFQKRFSKVYQVLKDCPLIISRYGVGEGMTKEEAIEKIKTLDKQQMYETIDAVPDTVISSQFRQYLYEKKQELQKTQLVQQITLLWLKFTAKAD